MGVDLSQRLVSDELWELIAPLPPLMYVSAAGFAWRYPSPTFGMSDADRVGLVEFSTAQGRVGVSDDIRLGGDVD
ncbi:hypothetical protein [Streptomyces griseiscabiei]|uniref:Transposase n=1 Tax=Streptomyces griseiscabiei TaxID=2993540 RepID=A0ABU4L622_9ACTN|nr:hypothetical protein [Streptomyces griseiscabiei]MBZ3906217.1 hypothetical protein [Streptomyces griseiscabiei]MDX2911212.1 hypothetical protein [Streptomyces griseiscabiei]